MGRARRKISDTFFYIPFGRFSQGEEAPPPYDQVLIGRENLRENFIASLFRMGRRGAFLITGRRGMGKTSFVRHCLNRYSDNVYGRFLRSDRGKNIPDMLTYVLLMTLLSAASLLALDLISFAAKGPSPHLLMLLALLPLLLFPAAYMQTLVIRAGRVLSRRRRRLRWLCNIGFIVLMCLAAAYMCRQVFFAFLQKKKDFASILAFWESLTNGAPLLNTMSIIHPISVSLMLCGVAFLGLAAWGVGADNRIRLGRRVVAILVSVGVTAGLGTWYVSHIMNHNFAMPLAIFLQGLTACAMAVHLSRYAGQRDTGEMLDTPQPSTVCFFTLCMLSTTTALVVAIARGWAKFHQILVVLVLAYLLGRLVIWLIGLRPHDDSGLLRPSDLHRLNKRAHRFMFFQRPSLLLLLKAFVVGILLIQMLVPAVTALATFALEKTAMPAAEKVFKWSYFGSDEYQWLLGLTCLLLSFSVFEFGWILRDRQLLREHEKLASHPVPLPNNPVSDDKIARDREWHAWTYGFWLERLTLPWHFLSQWLPSIVVEVNLGLNRLNHTDVIRSMLIGIRQRYHARFLAWNTPACLLATGILVLALVVAVEGIGGIWFEWRDIDNVYKSSPDICRTDIPAAKLPQIDDSNVNYARIQLCRNFPNLYTVLYVQVLPIPLNEHSILAQVVFHTVTPPPSAPGVSWTNPKAMYGIRGYHVISFALLLLLVIPLRKRWRVLPYTCHMAKIDELLQSLSGNVKARSERKFDPNIQRFLSGVSATESREVETPRTDGRSIELKFLALLEDLQRDSIALSRNASLGFSIPAPEFTFVFDELDKLGENRNSDGLAPSPQQSGNATPDQELRRSQDVLQLLADMKRILSAGQARFIFVGGRLLYDEWLADGVARVPLLTSIFDSQIYLPSLLVDNPFRRFIDARPRSPEMETRTREFLTVQVARARYMFRRWLSLTSLPVFGHPPRGNLYESFIGSEQLKLLGEVDSENGLRFWLKDVIRFDPKSATPSQSAIPAPEPLADRLREDFVRYLTYRSAGNPKRLRDLLATFVRPRHHALIHIERKSPLPELKDYGFRDVLRFSDMELCRTQFYSDVFSCLSSSFRAAMLVRDDKIAESIFFFSDFLFKFHRRAFSVANLERIDELEHVHRAPDVREVFRRLVEEFSQRYLHGVLNGMYDFRFRSDIAKEIDYLSRVSAIDMAAFNFTLNESQTLKEIYLDAVKAPDRNIDIVAGLAEVLDHEQEYDKARQYYRQGIDLIDASAGNWMSAPVAEVLRPGITNPDIDLRWAIIRLRLMLQIGMTFEQAGNFERAEVQYRSAYVLAWNVIRSYVHGASDNGFLEEGAVQTGDLAQTRHGRSHFLHVLKHLTLVYQPAFAIAWLAEKQMSDVDSSAPFIEQEISALRAIFPALNRCPFILPLSPERVRGSNFRLIAAELHGKAGDLYFFKGKQFATPAEIAQVVRNPRICDAWTGYQMRAYIHYAVNMHELRNYNWYRVRSSGAKYSADRKPTFKAADGPFFVHLSASYTLTNVSATLLSRLSLFQVLDEQRQDPWKSSVKRHRSLRDAKPDIMGPVNRWLFLDSASEEEWSNPARCNDQNDHLRLTLGHGLDHPLGHLSEWFGTWVDTKPNDYRCTKCDRRCWQERNAANNGKLIDLKKPHSMSERLLFSLHMLMSSAQYADKSHYRQQAAEKMLQVARNVSTLFWWLTSVEQFESGWDTHGLPKVSAAVDLAKESYWTYLFTMGLEAISEARRLYSLLGTAQSDTLRETPSVITLVCSFGLLSRRWGRLPVELQRRVDDLLRECCKGFPQEKEAAPLDAEGIRGFLREVITFYRYPVLNRLHALKIITDSMALAGLDPQNELDELRKLNARYDAPLHFTPLQLGHSAALVWLASPNDKSEEIRRLALEELARSRGMYTLGHPYYSTTISNLYYLYDDFNDHDIIFGHALQMAGMELTSLLVDNLKTT